MKTTVGDVELELWAKETPMACKNCIRLCLEGYWDDTIFHRIMKGFITQDGDPTDLIAMANAGKDDCISQFFLTLSSTPDLQNKHAIFGRVTGESIYSMLKLEEALVHETDRPLYPPSLIKTIILYNPFSDIVPRIIIQESEKVKDSSKTKKVAVKDFNLLSFGEEAEEDEEESVKLNKEICGKSKSAHDHLTDPKLSSQQAVEPPGLTNKRRTEDRSSY
ncbi:Peptidyl-prolyl cis-trans isomerase CWC27 like protein [Eufriesea mexicana]|uniref:Spliceosome-associated protein CWC27 homolog n=1 Tax=Eufriesea mexicana TaxID=516756 RepID=A0A310SCH8_9HYME|nr:Peptidyl-prolyl cis-trans isomerase CWC27 like protein [Eufriesea mexicana]